MEDRELNLFEFNKIKLITHLTYMNFVFHYWLIKVNDF